MQLILHRQLLRCRSDKNVSMLSWTCNDFKSCSSKAERRETPLLPAHVCTSSFALGSDTGRRDLIHIDITFSYILSNSKFNRCLINANRSKYRIMNFLQRYYPTVRFWTYLHPYLISLSIRKKASVAHLNLTNRPGEGLPGRASGSSTFMAFRSSSGLSWNFCSASRTTTWSWFSTNSTRWSSLTGAHRKMERLYWLKTDTKSTKMSKMTN